MARPNYSIIIPTYNRSYCLWKAILSIQNQSYLNWELLIVDDHSEDTTEQLIKEFKDSRIHYIKNSFRKGPSGARNTGILKAKGDYIAYLDSDEVVFSTWLETMDQHIRKNKDKVVFMPNKNYMIKQVNLDNQIIRIFKQKVMFPPDLRVINILNLEVETDFNGLIHKKAIIKEIGNWDEEMQSYEDYEFMFRILEKYPTGFLFIPLVLLNYTRTYGKDGLCSNVTYDYLVDKLEYIYKKHGKKDVFKKTTWYPSLINSYKKLALEGKTILNYLIENYG